MNDSIPRIVDHQPKLKSCPFDDGKAVLMHRSGSYGYYPGRYYVRCSACNAIGIEREDDTWIEGRGMVNLTKAAIADVVKHWNTRAGIAPTSTLIEE